MVSGFIIPNTEIQYIIAHPTWSRLKLKVESKSRLSNRTWPENLLKSSRSQVESSRGNTTIVSPSIASTHPNRLCSSPFQRCSPQHSRKLIPNPTLRLTLRMTTEFHSEEIPNYWRIIHFRVRWNSAYGESIFHVVKQQIQSQTYALNRPVNTLTSDVDRLHALVKNICSEDFKSGEYLDIFSDLANRTYKHLAEDS